MTTIAAITLILAACLFAQWRAQKHELAVRGNRAWQVNLAQRLTMLEQKASESYDPAAFEDLKNKVEALRLAKGMGVR